MSRRPPTAADTAERNRTALKTLTKLESNKFCADCKRNKHPRWASWNLGIFVCIRCSGIHRSLGVHISKVKSIDLDSWTDDQLASMVKWGNKRANRYWEHKLAEGHVPNEGKIESFIRTKYDSRRWAMEGPVPSDPATLDGEEGDDDVPLKVVQERARASSGSQRNGGVAAALPQPPRTRPQDVDLFGDPGPALARPSTTEPALSRSALPKAPVAPPKQTRPGESLLGLDFFGGTQSAPPQRPSSTGPTTPGMPGRTDLKQSILSLYASKPAAPPQQQQQQQQSNVSAFGGMQSPPLTTPQSNAQALGGLGDAFGSLSFSSPQPTPAAKPAPFSGFMSPTGHTRQASMTKSKSLSGGSFFDTKPAPPPKQATSPPAQLPRKESFGGDFGDFSSAISPMPAASTTRSPPPPAASGGGMGDLFDMASPAPAPPPKQTSASVAAAKSPPPISASNYMQSGAFNLSSPTVQPPPAPKQAQTSTISGLGSLSNMDAWGSSDAWATPDPTPAPAPKQAPAPPMQTRTSFSKPTPTPARAPTQMKMESPFDSGWGDAEPAAPAKPAPSNTNATSGGFGQSSSSGGFGQTQSSAGGFSVQQDEEFGGWSHASPVATTSGPKQGGLGGNSDDLFGNVWE